jgi:hypothetical protein
LKEYIAVMCIYPGPTDTRMAAGMEMHATFLEHPQKLAETFAAMS